MKPQHSSRGSRALFGSMELVVTDGLSWMRLRLAAGAAGIVMNSIPIGKAEPGGGAVPAGPACSAQPDRRELGLTGHWHQLTRLPKAHIGCPEGQ